MRKPIKILLWVLLIAVTLAGATAGGGWWYLQHKWRNTRGGVVVHPEQEWLKHQMLTPPVLRSMPLPGLKGQPTYFYYCEGDPIEQNHLDFQTTLSREEVLRVLEPHLQQHGYHKSGANYTRDNEEINVGYLKQTSDTWVKILMSRK